MRSILYSLLLLPAAFSPVFASPWVNGSWARHANPVLPRDDDSQSTTSTSSSTSTSTPASTSTNRQVVFSIGTLTVTAQPTEINPPAASVTPGADITVGMKVLGVHRGDGGTTSRSGDSTTGGHHTSSTTPGGGHTSGSSQTGGDSTSTLSGDGGDTSTPGLTGHTSSSSRSGRGSSSTSSRSDDGGTTSSSPQPGGTGQTTSPQPTGTSTTDPKTSGSTDENSKTTGTSTSSSSGPEGITSPPTTSTTSTENWTTLSDSSTTGLYGFFLLPKYKTLTKPTIITTKYIDSHSKTTTGPVFVGTGGVVLRPWPPSSNGGNPGGGGIVINPIKPPSPSNTKTKIKCPAILKWVCGSKHTSDSDDGSDVDPGKQPNSNPDDDPNKNNDPTSEPTSENSATSESDSTSSESDSTSSTSKSTSSTSRSTSSSLTCTQTSTATNCVAECTPTVISSKTTTTCHTTSCSTFAACSATGSVSTTLTRSCRVHYSTRKTSDTAGDSGATATTGKTGGGGATGTSSKPGTSDTAGDSGATAATGKTGGGGATGTSSKTGTSSATGGGGASSTSSSATSTESNALPSKLAIGLRSADMLYDWNVYKPVEGKEPAVCTENLVWDLAKKGTDKKSLPPSLDFSKFQGNPKLIPSCKYEADDGKVGKISCSGNQEYTCTDHFYKSREMEMCGEGHAYRILSCTLTDDASTTTSDSKTTTTASSTTSSATPTASNEVGSGLYIGIQKTDYREWRWFLYTTTGGKTPDWCSEDFPSDKAKDNTDENSLPPNLDFKKMSTPHPKPGSCYEYVPNDGSVGKLHCSDNKSIECTEHFTGEDSGGPCPDGPAVSVPRVYCKMSKDEMDS